MTNNVLLIICVFLWGLTTFLQKLSADRMSPLLMQIVVGFAFLCYIPFILWFQGGIFHLKWNKFSIIVTFIAALLSITGNIVMYTALSNNKHTGSSSMLVALYPTVTLILSAIFLNEQFNLGKLFGILLMVSGACLLLIF